MDFTNIIKTLEGDELNKLVIDPLIDELTSMNKYSVLPVYALQFVISKSDMVPRPILTAYDNKALITEASSLIPHLEDVIHEKTPKNITPAMIIYPEGLSYTDVVLGNADEYYYSSAYLIIGKELKDNLKNDKLKVTKIVLASDLGQRNIVTKVYWDTFMKEVPGECPEVVEPCIETMPFSIKIFKLPFSNYLESAKSLRTIVSAVSNPTDSNSITIEDGNMLTALANDIKEDQMIDIPGLNSIKIFKDFVKVKPNKIFSIFERERYDTSTITNVFFEMYFKSNHLKACIFYRYLDDIFDTLSGIYKE